MTIEVPEELEMALKVEANARGVSPEVLAREVLRKELVTAADERQPVVPFKTSRGILAKYGPAPSAEEIDQNRREMFRNFGESF